jgi:uncharacterized protein YndB with AHSA1/START domain
MTENKRINESEDDLVITRIFDAPRKLVFMAWTDPVLLKNWWAPEGCSTTINKVDLRVGGKFHFCMRMPDGLEIWGLEIYEEVVEPERLVLIDMFADANGNKVEPSHYGMSPGHPSETMVTITFSEQEGKTKLTLRHSIPRSLPEREGMEQGWSQMLESLSREMADVINGDYS